MNRTNSIVSIIFLLAAMGSIIRAAEPSRPNVVYFLVDDMGREDCGFVGGKEIRTPNIDKLADAGSKLDSFYVQPLCSPTRAALLTGRYPMRQREQSNVAANYPDLVAQIEGIMTKQHVRNPNWEPTEKPSDTKKKKAKRVAAK